VTSWAHGTTGLAAPCAPSRSQTAAPDFGVEGVRVATDYVGLGPVGEVHPYLSKPSEGNAVIDIVRAARQLPDAAAGSRWFSLGHSQGGHGALAAHELAARRAPELELLGTVAWSPASDFDRTFGGIDDVVARIVGAMGLYGAASEHPGLDPDDYVSPAVAAVAGTITSTCLDEIIEVLAPLAVDATFWQSDPASTPPARDVLLDNDVGDVAAEAPLLLISGTLDDRVVIDRVRSLFERLCAAGQVTDLRVLDGADHGDIVPRTVADATHWMRSRLAGEPPTDSCEDSP
jgi:acetyl esterase/lipase